MKSSAIKQIFHLVIESPHPKLILILDRPQGIFTFEGTGAKAIFISGTHRCSSAAFGEYSGTTSVCLENYESYKMSDVVHNVDSPFHIATEMLNNKAASLVLVLLLNKNNYNQKIDTQVLICVSGIYYCSVIEHGNGRVVLTQKNLKT